MSCSELEAELPKLIFAEKFLPFFLNLWLNKILPLTLGVLLVLLVLMLPVCVFVMVLFALLKTSVNEVLVPLFVAKLAVGLILT